MNKTQTSFIIETEGVPTLLAEAKHHYDWCDVDEDGNIVVRYRSSIIKYGTYSTFTNEASFMVKFGLANVMNSDGSKCWPLCDDFVCTEKAEDVERLATKLTSEKGIKKAIYYGRYHGNGLTSDRKASRYEFVIDDKYPTHVLFISDKWLAKAGNLYNCDVVTTKYFNALAIPLRTYKYLTRM